MFDKILEDLDAMTEDELIQELTELGAVFEDDAKCRENATYNRILNKIPCSHHAASAANKSTEWREQTSGIKYIQNNEHKEYANNGKAIAA